MIPPLGPFQTFFFPLPSRLFLPVVACPSVPVCPTTSDCQSNTIHKAAPGSAQPDRHTSFGSNNLPSAILWGWGGRLTRGFWGEKLPAPRVLPTLSETKGIRCSVVVTVLSTNCAHHSGNAFRGGLVLSQSILKITRKRNPGAWQIEEGEGRPANRKKHTGEHNLRRHHHHHEPNSRPQYRPADMAPIQDHFYRHHLAWIWTCSRMSSTRRPSVSFCALCASS